jgi:hypothetical protein
MTVPTASLPQMNRAQLKPVTRSSADAIDELREVVVRIADTLVALVESQKQIQQQLQLMTGKKEESPAKSARAWRGLAKAEWAYSNTHLDAFFYYDKSGNMRSSADLAKLYIESFVQGVTLYLDSRSSTELESTEATQTDFRERICAQVSELLAVDCNIQSDDVGFYLCYS